jgi:hypothetical protein
MARFFLPLLARSGADIERAYRDLREQAEALTGSVSRERRIQRLDCRREGLDCRLSVGEADAVNGRTVAAIVQLGRDTYTVHHVPIASGAPNPPTVLQRTAVYSVTDFD